MIVPMGHVVFGDLVISDSIILYSDGTVRKILFYRT